MITRAPAPDARASHIPALFGAEADGLTALRQSGTPLRVPAVVAPHDDDPSFLVIENLRERPTPPAVSSPG
jgi:fructosamine-3-kinase